MKRTRIRRSSKRPLAKLQKELWLTVRKLAEKNYIKDCYTCGSKNLEGRNCQLGHMIPKSTCGAYLKYDIRILRWQCAKCNIWNGGNGAIFARNMIIREGQEYVDQIFKDKLITLSGKQSYEHYSMQLEKYKLILEEL